jgi:hypothetical protein
MLKKSESIRFRDIFLLVLSLIVFGIIAIVDISFYHVPSFIKNFHTERELILILGFLAMTPFLNHLSSKFQNNYKTTLYFSIALLFGLILLISVTQLFWGNILNLWNNNPLLAENPDYWTLFSTFMTLLAASVLVIILFNLKYLMFFRNIKKSDLLFQLSIFLILIFSLVLNFYEDHYSYKQLDNAFPVKDLSRYAWIVGGLLIFTINSIKNSWIEELNPREKITALVFIIITLGFSVYFYLSPLITKLYALSVTFKGFILASFAYIIVYFITATLKLLFHIPLIGYHEQMENELKAVREISELITNSGDEEVIFAKIIKHITKIANADICWIESEKKDANYKILTSKNISRDRAEYISSIARNRINNKREFYYFDLVNDDIGDFIEDMPKKWKMLILVPVSSDELSTNLYLISTKKSSFKASNINSLKTFLSFLKIVRGGTKAVSSTQN